MTILRCNCMSLFEDDQKERDRRSSFRNISSQFDNTYKRSIVHLYLIPSRAREETSDLEIYKNEKQALFPLQWCVALWVLETERYGRNVFHTYSLQFENTNKDGAIKLKFNSIPNRSTDIIVLHLHNLKVYALSIDKVCLPKAACNVDARQSHFPEFK